MKFEALNIEQINAVMAGLRLLQLHSSALPSSIEEIATDGGQFNIMCDDEIEDLSEKINTEGLSFGE